MNAARFCHQHEMNKKGMGLLVNRGEELKNLKVQLVKSGDKSETIRIPADLIPSELFGEP